MNYLHTRNPPVLHRDLKSANILLDELYSVKICDFGLSRLKSFVGATMTGECGTTHWMAPEVRSYVYNIQIYRIYIHIAHRAPLEG